MSRTRTSDVIRNFVLEGKDKAKDTGPEDKDLQKQQGQERGQGLEAEDKAENLRPSLRPRPKHSRSKPIRLHLKGPTTTTHYRQLG